MKGKAAAATALLLGLLVGVLLVGVVLKKPAATTGGGAGEYAKYNRPVPMPHQWWKKNEEFYVFASGGQQGGLYVYGVPSMKYLSEIPIFNEDEAWGWTLANPEVKKMLTNPATGQVLRFGDTHHPIMSRKNGVYDGKWVFIPDKPNPRVARIDLSTFRTAQILWVPNVNGGLHGDHVTPNTDLMVVNIEHEQDPDPVIKEHIGIKFDPLTEMGLGGFVGISIADDGTMKNKWQVWGPWQHDLLRMGWGKSDGWIINTSYNTERARDTLGMFGKKTDYLYVWNVASIEKAVADGKYVTTKAAPDVPVIKWTDVEGYLVPIPLNPHGVDLSPTGSFSVTSGKATSAMTIVNMEKVFQAIKDKSHFVGKDWEKDIIDPEWAWEGQIDAGLGPLHSDFDDQGYFYTSFFVDSDVKKMSLPGEYVKKHGKEPLKVVDVLPSHFSTGHLSAPGGDSAHPYGKYLIVLNKLTKDTFLPHGPMVTENHELFKIDEIPAKLIDQMAIGPETHYAQAMPVADVLKNMKDVYTLPEELADPAVEYDYGKKEVHVFMRAIRPIFTPNQFTVPQGWTVKIQITSEEEAYDISHGFTIDGYDVSESIDPGEVKHLEFLADKPGTYHYYCIWFCSELHMEMRGRMIVIPEAEWTKDKETVLQAS